VSVDVEVVADVHAVLGEGPLWDAQRGRLLWLDIDAGALHGFDGREDHLVRRFAAPLAAACLAGGDRMLLGIGLDVVEAEIRDGGGHALRRIARAGAGDRINDGTCDPRGRFFFGTLSARTGGAALYRLDPDGGLTSVLEGTTISNGLDWSPDGASMYFVDTPTRTIDVYDYDLATGTASARRPFVRFDGEGGNPDGLTVDAEGRVWVAMCHGGAVRCYEASGTLADVIAFPVKKVTSVAFGGPALDELYVTSGSWAFTPRDWQEQPHAGALFRCRPGATGRPPHRFGAAGEPDAPTRLGAELWQNP